MSESKKYKVKVSDFVVWYFADEDIRDMFPGVEIQSALIKEGKYTIDVKELFDACLEIPTHILSPEYTGDEYSVNVEQVKLLL